MILKKSPFLETCNAVIKHLVQCFHRREPQPNNLATIHAMWIIISFLIAAPAQEKEPNLGISILQS